MEIYLTDLETNTRLRFPMLPESINVQTATQFYNYQIIKIGEVRLPSGESLQGISWNGILPGERRKNEPYIKKWKNPASIHKQLRSYRAKKLKLMVTETVINLNVYISNYTFDLANGYGDISYSIQFVQAKDLKVYASGASGKSTGTADTAENKPQGDPRPEPPPAKTYTVVKGDSLWAIAQKIMGDGSKYPALYGANTAVIDPRNQKYNMPKYTIYAGQVLTIPS